MSECLLQEATKERTWSKRFHDRLVRPKPKTLSNLFRGEAKLYLSVLQIPALVGSPKENKALSSQSSETKNQNKNFTSPIQ